MAYVFKVLNDLNVRESTKDFFNLSALTKTNKNMQVRFFPVKDKMITPDYLTETQKKKYFPIIEF